MIITKTLYRIGRLLHELLFRPSLEVQQILIDAGIPPLPYWKKYLRRFGNPKDLPKACESFVAWHPFGHPPFWAPCPDCEPWNIAMRDAAIALARLERRPEPPPCPHCTQIDTAANGSYQAL